MTPPPFVTWVEALSTQLVGEDLCFWSKPKTIGLNLSEDLFFWSSPNFGRKIVKYRRKNLGQTCSFRPLFFSNFLRFLVPPPPPFQNPTYATVHYVCFFCFCEVTFKFTLLQLQKMGFKPKYRFTKFKLP